MKRVIVALLLLVTAAATADAQYRYGNYRSRGGGGDGGFFIELEGGLTSPRNVDVIYATEQGGSGRLLEPDWGGDVSGRAALGWAWGEGNRLTVSGWFFESEEGLASDAPGGGTLNFGIGPPIANGATFLGAGGAPGAFGLDTELSAQSGEITFTRASQLSDDFTLEWTAGFRLVHFEEESFGTYSSGTLAAPGTQWNASKLIESDMFGGKIGLAGAWRLASSWSVRGGAAFSGLSGEITGTSSLTPVAGGAGSFAEVNDDNRSATILDLELALVLHLLDDRLEFWAGWDQAEWRDVPTDLLRNFAGTVAPLPPRDELVFSTFKLGGRLRF